ncbi:MAG: SRPBCC domain-containing protein [Chitinophagaceae bacterium]
MKNNLIVLERLFDVPTKRVWKALTDSNEMKNWYFNLKSFKAQVGFQFQFRGGHDERIQYLHLCEITEVVPNKKLSYSWRYDGYPGVSFVTFELFDQGNKTLLKLTHSGIETFPIENPDFALHNFENGWNEILNKSLRNHLEKENFRHEITVNASLEKVFESITKEIALWWTEMFEGRSSKLGESFTVRFGPAVFKTMRIEELIPNEKVVWFVTDTLIDIPELNNKKEWLNTKIVWELKIEKTNTVIRVTHIGLNPDIECYDICTTGWRQFCDSLKSYLEKGSGMPFKQDNYNK